MSSIPDTIGPYEVLRPIAQGGMAEVFEVRDPDSGEHRAVKLLVALDTSIKRFNREFEAMTRLNHPNIVRVYRYGYQGNHPWMSMELLRGEPLQVHVKDFGPPGVPRRTEEVVRVAFHVANALQYVHDRGLVHRDLKSANVQVLRDGRVKLLDFGTAHLVDPLERITQEGDFVGTFSYAAPEQIIGGAIDHRADLYALGILLYRLLSGRRPFHASDPHKVAHMHLHTMPKPLSEIVPELPPALDRLVMWLLAKKPQDRPQHAQQVAAELEKTSRRSLAMVGLGLSLYDDQALGRASELRTVWRVLDEDEVGLVLVSAGDREERASLLDQVQRDAARRGWAMARLQDGMEPMEALSRALASLVPEAEADLRTVLQEAAPLPIREATLAHVAEPVGRALSAGTLPVLLLLDEVAATPEVLQVVVRVVGAALAAGGELAVVASVQRADPDTLAELRQLLGLPEVIDLSPIDERRTALAIGHLLNRRPPPPATARRLHETTGGRPSLVQEMVRGLVTHGKLGLRDDDPERVDWGAAEALLFGVPEEVRALVEERVGTLPAAWRQVLEVLDLLGGEATVHEIAHGLGLRVAELAIVLRELGREGLVSWGGLPRDPVRPADPLVMRWVGAMMPPWRRAMLQHLVASLLESQAPTPAQVRLLVAVGRTPVALERAVVCSRALLEKGEVSDALELLELVHGHADHPGLGAALRVGFHLTFAEAVQRSRPMDARAIRSLETAERLAVGTARAAEVKLAAAEQQRAIGHYGNHRKFLLEAWDLVANVKDAPFRARVALDIARSFLSSAQITQARAWFDAALETALSVDDRDTADLSRIGLAEIQLAMGEAAATVDVLDRLIVARGEQGDPSVRGFAVAVWGHAMRRLGAYTKALPRLQAAVAEMRDGQSVPAWAAVTLSAASLELDLFRLGRAQELVEELASALTPGERLDVRLETRLFQGRLELASGQPLGAAFRLEEVVDQAEKAGLSMLVELGRAWLGEARVGIGALAEAKLLYQRALLGLMATGNLVALADAVVSRARAFGASEDPTKAFKLVGKLLQRRLLQPLVIEHLLAEMRWGRAQGDRMLAAQAAGEVRTAVNRLASTQGDIEQAALRVHPWAHELLKVDLAESASGPTPSR